MQASTFDDSARRETARPRYFKPLRRKIGLVTLALACVLAAGWVRSQYLLDTAGFVRGIWRSDFTSQNGKLWLIYVTYDRPRESGFLIDSTRIYVPQDLADLPARQSKLDWRWDWIGFHFSSSAHFHNSIIPYWAIVVPLTLLSAWLLLSKPREITQSIQSPLNLAA